jgi:hypothetical protein
MLTKPPGPTPSSLFLLLNGLPGRFAADFRIGNNYESCMEKCKNEPGVFVCNGLRRALEKPENTVSN